MTTAKYYTITNGQLTLCVNSVGAAIQSLIFEKADGTPVDLILGYEDPEDYTQNPPCFGAIPGRVANRIAGASFQLNGTTYTLDANENGNTLHGGFDPYQNRIWSYSEERSRKAELPSVVMQLHSPDGDQGFPGNLDLTVTYSLTEDNTLLISYEAISDQDTLLNVTNHSYFNLSGHDHGPVYEDHLFQIPAESMVAVDEHLIPLNELASVEDTPFDLRTLRSVDPAMDYDHCYVLNGGFGTKKACGTAYSKTTGICLEATTDMPGVQFYTANTMVEDGKAGAHYPNKSGFCLETEFFPDSIHHSDWEQPVLKADETFSSLTSYRFSERPL